ncbi:class I SAM-dependent methyltransferase [Cupriavidus sp. RAF12]|uniref:class I SAM-dependent methyltransferase n=1 Tax=Cupriavidus sp. RAF12 TaxID=3233050 RepID=UPI003F92152D
MSRENTPLLAEVASYYSGKLAEHGANARGVDWNGEASQALRFQQLCRVIEDQGSSGFSINDLGCGYGALYEYLHRDFADVSYLGIDVSAEMIGAARERFDGNAQARFLVANAPDAIADYGVASGIFNVRMGRSDEDWARYLESTLDVLDGTSRLGFAFNCLTSYSDADKMRPDLYYADPCRLFDLCKRKYSRQVALLHDYGLYEFTMIVRKVP